MSQTYPLERQDILGNVREKFSRYAERFSHRKWQTYISYFQEYLQHGNIYALKASTKYLLFRKTLPADCVVSSEIGKFYCRGNTTDFLFVNYSYEKKVKAFIEKHASNYHVFLDIGACIGDYSIWMAKNGFRTIAFEPVPDNYRSLIINVHLNKLEHSIQAFNFGLGKKAASVPFHIRTYDKGASGICRSATNDENALQVKILPLDNLISRLNIPEHLGIIAKLDVEGMEEEVIEGAARFFSRYPRLMLIIESKISGEDRIINKLNAIGDFNYIPVDEHNMAAVKQ